VAHTNPSYSRGKDQEDHGSKQPRGNSIQHNKRAGGMAQVVENLPIKQEALFKLQYHGKKKTNINYCASNHPNKDNIQNGRKHLRIIYLISIQYAHNMENFYNTAKHGKLKL
jgi:hypothetical protein